MRRPSHGDSPGEEKELYFPTYEELAADLLEQLEGQGLAIQEVGHDLEPATGERTFQCTLRLPTSDSTHRYSAMLHFHWDALLTYVGTYGPGSECELYHEDEETCSHRRGQPHPIVEIICEYDLGDGGYELRDLSEIDAWIKTVEGLLGRAVAEQEGRTIHVGLAVRDGSTWVDRFFAEQAWYVDMTEAPDLGPICTVVATTLRATPALADRLPL